MDFINCSDAIRNDVILAAIGPLLGGLLARFGAAWLATRLFWRVGLREAIQIIE